MDISFRVENVSPQTRPNVASIDGATLSVIVPEIEVELQDSSGKHGSLQLHFRTPDEQAYALAAFKPGSTVTVSFPDAPVVEQPVVVEQPTPPSGEISVG